MKAAFTTAGAINVSVGSPAASSNEGLKKVSPILNSKVCQRRKRFIKKCKEFGIPVTQLKKYAIENYFTLNALKEVFGDRIPDSITELSPNIKVEEQIGFSVKKSNRDIAKCMPVQDISSSDLGDFFNKVEKICETSR